jgi:hypothetical protein
MWMLSTIDGLLYVIFISPFGNICILNEQNTEPMLGLIIYPHVLVIQQYTYHILLPWYIGYIACKNVEL